MGGGDKTRFIMDCDTGTDDAQALMMALARDDVIMTAVTCVFGNCAVDNVARNVLRVLKVCNRLDVSYYDNRSNNQSSISPVKYYLLIYYHQ